MSLYTPTVGSTFDDDKVIALKTLDYISLLGSAGTTGDAIKTIPLTFDVNSGNYVPFYSSQNALSTADKRSPIGLLYDYSGQQSPSFDVVTNGGVYRAKSGAGTNNTIIRTQDVNGGESTPLLFGFQVTNTAITDRFIKFYANNTFNAATEILNFCIHQGQSYSYTPIAPVAFHNYLSFNFSTAYDTNVGVSSGDLIININWAYAQV